LAVLYGLSDEWHQSFVPGRTPDVVDILTDAIGAAIGLLLVWWISQRLERTADHR
jgi:VanZ family protein